MMDIEDIRLLYGFNSWANQRTRAACAALTPEQFTKGLGSSFSSVRDTLAHLLGAEWIWLERWMGRTPAVFPKAADFPDLVSLERRWAEIERELAAYIASLKPEDLGRVLHFKTMAGTPQEDPLWQTLQHLVNHGSYHRGQIATMLRQLGAKPNSTDLVGYYRELAVKAKAGS
jgi:uncharacterized damage-inducible protein DinB